MTSRPACLDGSEKGLESLAGNIDGTALSHSPAVKRPADNGARLTLKFGENKPSPRVEGLQAIDPGLEGRLVLLEQGSGAGSPGEGIAAGHLIPDGQNIAADAVAEKVGGGIARVFAPGHTGGTKGGDELGLFQGEQRPEMNATRREGLDRARGSEAAEAAAAGEAHEHGLRNIVLLVA